MITLQVFNVCVAFTSFVLATFVATRERQQETMRLYVSAAAASQAKSAFINMAAHELRTPLTVVTGYLSMIEALLLASQIEAGNGSPEGQVIDLRNVVEDAVGRARPRADLLRDDISTNPAPSAVLVQADRVQLGRVLDNLINNGLSYSVPPARLFIDLSTDSGWAKVRVEDTGVGIPDDQREQVFDRFYRGASPAVTKVGGVGPGLYISRELAERYGGRLVGESSTPGVGTVFALALPIAG